MEIKQIREEINRIFSLMQKAFERIKELVSGDFITTGLTPNVNRCTILFGGYKIVGDRCFVEITLDIKASLSANDYWVLMTGFPAPKYTYASLAGCTYQGTAPINGMISNSTLLITLGNQAMINGSRVMFAGSYIVGGGGTT